MIVNFERPDLAIWRDSGSLQAAGSKNRQVSLIYSVAAEIFPSEGLLFQDIEKDGICVHDCQMLFLLNKGTC